MPRALIASTAALALLLAGRIPATAQEDPYLLEGLVVTASPTPRPLEALASHVTVLQGSALRAEGLTRVAQALRLVPGLDVVQGGSTGANTSLFLRGGESDYVLVMVDGVQVNQPGGSFDFSSLSLNDVERIEIVRGPASALYGSDAMVGVIQVITKGGEGPARFDARAQAGSYGRRVWSADVAGGGSRASGSLGLSRLTTNGTLPFNNEYANTTLSVRADLSPDPVTRARFTLHLGDHTYHFPTDGSGRLVDRNQFTHERDVVAGMSATRLLAGSLELHGQAGLSRTHGGTEDPPDGPADTLGYFASSSLATVQRASAKVRVSYHLRQVVATIGSEIDQEWERSSTSSSSQWGSSADRSRYARWNRAYYAALTGGGADATFDLGVRLEDNERFGRLWTWQAGSTWRPLGPRGPRLRGSVGLGIKEPTFYENYATGFARGDPDLRPERARSWEVGVDQELVDGVTVSASYFSQRFRDLIQYTATSPTPDAPSFYNVATASAAGVELEAAVRAGPLGLHGSWTRTRTRVLDAGLDAGGGAEFVNGGRLLRRPTNAASLAADYAAGPRVLLNAQLRVVGSRDDRDFSTYPATRVRLSRYEDLSCGGEVRLWDPRAERPGLTLTLRGENLLGESYQEVFGFPAAGRSFLVGGRVVFGPQGR